TSVEDDGGTLLSFTWSAGEYFRTMGIEVLQGRAFSRADQLSGSGNVLVSRSAAQLLWPGRDPVGQRLKMQEAELWETVVGVVDDVRQYGFRQEAQPMVYFPLVGQDPENRRTVSSPAYVLKTPRAEDIGPEIRAMVREVAPTAPMYRTYTLAGLASRSMVQLSFTMLTIAVTAILALILGVVGLYGVLSYAVAERTREIGVRMALGAEAARVLRMVVGQGARVLAVGVAVGLGVALLATRTLETLLFEVRAFDAPIYLAVSLLTGLVGLAASYLPARRAARVDPMESLRTE
ncbi:MAG: ABC transporter permease, partial [Holophagales bacterium]|nr:ABC transporter permease [Holophagales bacterium]